MQYSCGGDAQVDMYEVVTSLCRLLFHTYTVNDALLFTKMLSMDLRTLRRLGYNGDYKPLSFFDPLTGLWQLIAS